ncbi:MAG: glutamate N-acetyltransferase/amino-acid N-acetyltransferase [Cellvibrionaceae bacterium]|jgi:glutamate N-acetyltransferase/amino-acid N-acetyltransferase
MPVIKGVKLNAVSAGIKKNNGLDLILIELPETATVAGVFTQNAFCAAPVTLCKEHLNQTSNARYLLINSGNANACTGEQGMVSALVSCSALAEETHVDVSQVLPFSTGVIGEPLAVEKIVTALPALVSGLTEDAWPLAAKGIMTTDTHAKGASVSVKIGKEILIVNGIAKGAGMIKPDMATMLAYIATNADIDELILKQILKEAADLSFNRITIDGDTSTNDSCILMATGTSSIAINDAESKHYAILKKAVIEVLASLAQAIVRDGEGATKFVTVKVEEGLDSSECLDVAYAIAHSPLVKTAFFASDPNWGRIVAAIGNAGLQNLDVEKIKVYLDQVLIVENAGRAESYSEEDGQEVMNQPEICIRVCLARGGASETIWTTDLSHEYVKINAEYRT